LRNVTTQKRESAATVTIEIHRPELEALIRQRMKMYGFNNVEDALMQALETAPVLPTDAATASKNRTGADLIAAMQSSPYREIEIEPPRYPMPVRDATF
jgi:hypothetical protein